MAASANYTNREEQLSFLPKSFRDKLMPFQKDGILYGLSRKGRCLIADEMGLGKTVQALALAYYYRDEWPLLIVVPASLRYPWIEEVEKWLPEIHPHDINLIQGGSDISMIPVARITVVTYGLLRHPSGKMVQEALYNQQYKVVIVDESHYIKNRKAATTKYMVSLLQRCSRKILLTGTPALARPEELFPQLDSILPGQFGTWTHFAKRYCDAKYRYIGRIRKWVTDGASNLEELENLLKTKLMIRRLKKDVLKELPSKQRQRITFELKESDIKKELDQTFEQLNVALDQRHTSLNSFLSSDIVHSTSVTSNQSVADPVSASSTQIYSILCELNKKTCLAKIGPVKEYLNMLCDNKGLKFIVFAFHRIMMDSLAEQLVKDNIKFIRIDGQTPMSDRPHLVQEFQVDPGIRCALLSIKAAGVGLTLTAAKLVVFAELDWTPGTLEQCEDRAHRIGQNDTVHVHYLVAKGTLDERVWAALCRKTTVITTTLNGKRQVLRMADGDERQIKCLSSADAYKPKKNQSSDLYLLLQTPQPKNQRSIVDFFTPKGSKNKTRMTVNLMGDKFNVVEDDEDDGAFRSPTTENDEKKKRKNRSEMSELSETDLDDSQSPSSKRCRVDKISLTAEDEGQNPNTWSCEACTFINSKMLNCCEICSTPKQKNRPQSSKFKSSNQTFPLTPPDNETIASELNCLKLPNKNNPENGSQNDLTFNTRMVHNISPSTTGSEDGNISFGDASDVIILEHDSDKENALDISTCDSDGEGAGCDCKLKHIEDASLTDTSVQSLHHGDEEDKHQDSDTQSAKGKDALSVNDKMATPAEERLVDLDSVPVYDLFRYCCSKNTNRIYLYDENNIPLNANFTPLDVDMDNFAELPVLLLRPENLKLVKRFVREWNSLAPTKRRLIAKSGEIMTSPCMLYDKLKSVQHNTQRYTSKMEVATAALNKAAQIGGTVRVLLKPKLKTDMNSPKQKTAGYTAVNSEHQPKNESLVDVTNTESLEYFKGTVQAVSEDGTPLCIHCQKPYYSELVSKETVESNIWQTRFCSQLCRDQYWMKGSRGYCVEQVYREEHGICQLCGMDAQQLYDKVRNTSDLYQRAKLIQESKYGTLTPAVKKKMAKDPVRGMFWQIDHIKPVIEGGGSCDIDNLRTLCVLCHREVTAQLLKNRAKEKQARVAAKCGDIKAFFKTK